MYCRNTEKRSLERFQRLFDKGPLLETVNLFYEYSSVTGPDAPSKLPSRVSGTRTRCPLITQVCQAVLKQTFKGEVNPKIKFILFERTFKITE